MLKKLAVIALLICTLTSCAVQRMVFSDNYQSEPKTLAHKGTSHFVILGWYQRSTFDATKYCGSADNVHSVELRKSPVQYVIMIATVGIYSPKEIKIYCKQ
ncbi:MAG: hypothetical protein ACI9TO_000943 [Rickettsiales bacterium]|jgi:hypothetical protein